MIEDYFPNLKEFFDDEYITDINYNGKDLWLDHLLKGRICIKDYLEEKIMMQMVQRFSNAVNEKFNVQNPVLESDLDHFRVSILHPSLAQRLSISIRKSSTSLRLSEQKIIEEAYLNKSSLRFLKFAVQAKSNIMISGLPGAGKTELLKFLTQYIPDHDRVITIEDSYELHYDILHPQRDSVKFKVNEQVGYRQAIKASLRQRANWVLLSEVRGDEVVDLLNTASSGTHLMSTIHAQTARQIPQRIKTLLPLDSQSLKDQVEDLIHVGIHVDIRFTRSGIKRFVREIIVFDQDEFTIVYHYKDKKDARKIPDMIREKGKIYGVNL